MLPNFISEAGDSAFSRRVQTGNKEKRQQGENLTTYCQVINYFQETCATHDIISKAETEIVNFEQRARMAAVCYSEVLWENCSM